MIVAQIHESLMHLNDNFELYFGDKDMHFIVMAVLGMILFFMVHFVFKRLAKWSITAISFIYVFTVMTVLGLAIEIGQKLTWLHSSPANSFWKCQSVVESTGRRSSFFSVPTCTVNILLSMVAIGSRLSTTSTIRKKTSSRLAGLETNARSR